MFVKRLIWLVPALVLAACASTRDPETVWTPRQDADLSKDMAACKQEARTVDLKSRKGYSDSRYGAVAAMAGRMDGQDMKGVTEERLFQAVIYACMTDKGWKPAAES